MADTALTFPDLDDRQLLVELQSLGVHVQDERDPEAGRGAGCGGGPSGRRGGAGPSDALFLWVRGLPLTVPWHAAFVERSPYIDPPDRRRRRPVPRRGVRQPGQAASPAADLRHGDCRRDPVLEDRAAPPRLDRLDRGPEVHLLGDRRAVRLLRHRADARRADDPGQDTGAAGRGVHGRARLRRRGRRHAHDRLDQPPRSRRAVHQPLRGGDQGRLRPAHPGPVRAARRPRRARAGPRRRRRRGRDPHRDVRPGSAPAGRRRQGQVRGRGVLPLLGARGRGVRARPRDHIRDPRDGGAARADRGRVRGARSPWACTRSWFRSDPSPAR